MASRGLVAGFRDLSVAWIQKVITKQVKGVLQVLLRGVYRDLQDLQRTQGAVGSSWLLKTTEDM